MRPILALALLLGAVMGVLGIVLSAPPFMAEVAGIVGVSFAVALAVILRGPVGKALFGGGEPPADWQQRIAAQLEDLIEEVRAVRQDQFELQDRLDFAERLLARQGEAARLSPPEEGA